MDKFIIKYKTRIMGVDTISYHAGISLVDSKRGFMNVYSESISTDKSKAQVFFTREEAEKVSSLFAGPLHIAKVIKK